MNYRLTVFLVLLFAPLYLVSADYKLVLQRGHSDTPIAIKWHEQSRVLISVGEDGFLIVTRPEDKIVLHRFRITRGEISNLDINQSNEQAAIVYFENGFFTVSVWNWASEEIIYEHRFDKELLFVTWSARGAYLVLGTFGSPSIVMLDGVTGRRLPKLQSLPLLYDYGYIGSTETILMTYTTSGFIRYWDIDTSELKHSVKTISNLRGLSVLQTEYKSILFAYQNDALILLDRQTGYVLDRLDIPGLIDVSIDEKSGEVDAIVSTARGFVLHRYESGNNEFIPRSSGETHPSRMELDDPLQPVKILRVDGTTYLMSKDGYIVVGSAGEFLTLIDDQLWDPDSFAFHGDSISIAGGGKILRFTSSFFSSDSEGDISDLVSVSREIYFSKSSAEHTGILVLSDGAFLLWDKNFSGNNNGIKRFHPPTTDTETGTEFFFPTTDMISKCSLIDENRIFTVNRNGVVNVWDSKNGVMLAEYSSLDNLDAAYSVKGELLLVGRSSRGSTGTPLEAIDMNSGETKPVPDKRFMVYLIESEPENIYTVGMRKTSSYKTETILRRHDPKRVERSKILLRVSGEISDAIVLPHPDNNSVYTNLGGKIVRIPAGKTATYEYAGSIVFLQIRGENLYGLDTDGSLVVWDNNGGMPILKINFFDNGSWVLSSADTIWASPGAIDKIVIFENGNIVDPRLVCKILES